jgi:hypothetical protein
VVRHSNEKGAIIILAFFFSPYIVIFEEKNVEDWYFENSCCKNGFFLFLVLKTGKLSNFTLDKFVVPLVSVGVHNFFYETT